jgi:peptidoglycan-associated lipoprotein
MNKLIFNSLLALFFVVAGCTTSGDIYDDEHDQFDAGDDVDVTALDEDCKPPCAFLRSALEDPASILAGRLIFFDYDSAEIKPEYQELLTAHSQYLASYPNTKIRLEGHTDERGSREYNLALGEERSKSVRRLLLLQNVADGNINVVSFGEELPMDLGHDESAWRQNRRVEIVYEDL